jgi:hypothetical protein
VTPLSPLDEATRATIRAALVAASGNVRAASRVLYPERTARGAYNKVHREIRRLGLLDWLNGEYELAARQPRKVTT